MLTNFFGNNLTTLTTNEPYYANDAVITIYCPADADTTSSTVPLVRRYRVKVTRMYSADVTPIVPVNYERYFPTRRELNDRASLEGARGREEEHCRIPRKALVLRASYQDSPRLPGYRGKRPR